MDNLDILYELDCDESIVVTLPSLKKHNGKLKKFPIIERVGSPVCIKPTEGDTIDNLTVFVLDEHQRVTMKPQKRKRNWEIQKETGSKL